MALIERHSVGRAVVVLGHDFQRAIKRSRRRRDGCGLGRRNRHLHVRRSRPGAGRRDRRGDALGRRHARPAAQNAAGPRQVEERAASRPRRRAEKRGTRTGKPWHAGVDRRGLRRRRSANIEKPARRRGLQSAESLRRRSASRARPATGQADSHDSTLDWSPQVVPRFNRSLRSIHHARNNHCHRKSAVTSATLKVRCKRPN